MPLVDRGVSDRVYLTLRFKPESIGRVSSLLLLESTPVVKATPAPTIPHTAYTRIVTHPIRITGLEARSYHGSLQRVYETAYGIAVGIFNAGFGVWQPGCSVVLSALQSC